MKIGLVIDDSLERPDGVQQYVLTLGNWLSENGHNVRYISSGAVLPGLSGHYSPVNNITVRFNKNRLSIPLPASKKRITQILDDERFDILHVQMPFNPLLSSRIINANKSKAKIIATFHILPYSTVQSVLTKALLRVQVNSIGMIDEFICVSEAAQKFLAAAGIDESVVIPNLVNINAFKLNKPGKTHDKIVCLGRLVERKGAKYLIKAYAELDESLRRKTPLVVAGKGPLMKELKQLAKELKVEVEFPGFISESDKPLFLSSAKLAVYPSTGGESFGIVLIEAMAAGAGAVVGGDNPGYREVLEPKQMLIQPQNTRGFSRLLERLLTSDSFRKSVYKIQKEHVKDYDTSVVGPQIVKIYEKS